MQPFIVTSVHAGKEHLADMEPDARKIFAESQLSKDPDRLNVFLFVLDEHGAVIHECHGVPGGRRGGAGRSDWTAEISKARAILKLPESPRDRNRARLRSVPDLETTSSVVPAGVRIFVRHDDADNSRRSQLPVVEVVPMMADQWTPLAWSPTTREIEAETLRDWLVWFYPAAIRTADESKRFQQFRGTLQLEPAESGDQIRYAILHGDIRMGKGDDNLSSFEGTFQAVLSYRPDSPEVQSVQGVVEGVYLYRQRGTTPQKLKIAIESRPSLQKP